LWRALTCPELCEFEHFDAAAIGAMRMARVNATALSRVSAVTIE
jgi:hypothetical protein